MYSFPTWRKQGVQPREGFRMVTDVKEKLDKWRYSRAWTEDFICIIIIFFTHILNIFIMQRYFDRNLGQNKLKKLPKGIFSNYSKLKAL